MYLDILVFAAHPDDAELAMGGTIAKLTKQNFKAGIIDMTRGEMGTRGTAEMRQKEAFQSAIVLKTSVRENLSFPDGNIERTKTNLCKLVMAIRKFKPKIIFAPYFNDRHPDHIDASVLVKEAMFTSGLAKFKSYENEVLQEAYRPKKLFYYMQTYTFDPSFIVDISDSFVEKMNAIQAYSTQFHNPRSTEPETFISRPEFLHYIEARSRFFGFQIGKRFGEPFYCEEKIEFDITSLLQ